MVTGAFLGYNSTQYPGPLGPQGLEITPNHRAKHPVPCSLDLLSLQGLSLVSGRMGHILSPPVSPGRFRSRWDAAHPPKAIRWSHHLKSALLSAFWPSTTATTSPYPIIGRAEGTLLPPGCNSIARGTNLSGGNIVWMYGHVTAGRRPANRARQFQMGLT